MGPIRYAACLLLGWHDLKGKTSLRSWRLKKTNTLICIHTYFALAIPLTCRFGVWSRSHVSMTSRLTVKKSTLSSGAPQAPAQITPTPTSCLPGRRLTIYNSHSIPYTAANHTGQLLMKSWLVVFTMSCVYVEPYRCVCEGHKPWCFLTRRNYVSGKISPGHRCACMYIFPSFYTVNVHGA